MVKTGLEVLLQERPDLLKGKRVGVIANPSSVNAQLDHVVDLLHRHPEVHLTTIMGPQHGARGETQDNMIEWEDYRDPVTGLPVYSLYGKTRKPTAEMLKNVDVLIFDIQDVGARYYTFVYTMALAMEACGEQGRQFIVLDRPNPIGGVEVEGPVLDPAFRSFVGLFPLAIRHGLTVGELARYFCGECGVKCRLEVVPMKGWRRDMFFDDTELPWIMPSPNIPTLDSALVYPGLCLLEGTNVSEGRGTTRPFEMSGAPWISPEHLAKKLNGMSLPGVRFRPIHYIPTFHKWSGTMVGGVQVHVLDRHSFRPFATGLALLMAYRDAGPDKFRWKEPPYEYEYDKLPIDILLGNGGIRQAIERGESLEPIEAGWQEELQAFKEKRNGYLLY
ncbi:MAG: exo-beta-N-acetylmuramidase NamZ domain-containing protein [Acidobacteriota bacterium]